MVRSKFNFWAILPLLLVVFIPAMLYFIISNTILASPAQGSAAVWFVIPLFTFAMVWLVFGEIRTKLVGVRIEGNSITVRSLWGIKNYSFKELSGFKTSLLPSNSRVYEYLYLFKENKKVIKLSAFYHSNYPELKQEIASKAQFLGEEPFSFFRELKEIFI